MKITRTRVLEKFMADLYDTSINKDLSVDENIFALNLIMEFEKIIDYIDVFCETQHSKIVKVVFVPRKS